VDPDRHAAWVKAVGRLNVDTKQEWQPSQHSVICSEHFCADDFIRDRGNTLLKKCAMPTVFNFPHVAASVSFYLILMLCMINSV